MIFIHNINKLSRMCRDYWCCEYVVTYSTADGTSDCETMIGVKL